MSHFFPNLLFDSKNTESGGRMVGLGFLPPPGLEEGGQANQRCSLHGSGLSELGEQG